MYNYKEELTRRARLLEDMDVFIRDNIGDDDITEMWLMYGLPDDCSDECIIEIAKDSDCFTDIVKCFSRCVATANDLGNMTFFDYQDED